MTTKKRKRPYSQDFSGNSMTDTSFSPACDVNNIVRHYQTTGIDPYQDRIKAARYAEASTLSYEDAMRNKAAFDSYEAENPDWRELAQERAEAAIADDPSLPHAEQGAQAPDASGVAKPAPQDASDGES